MARKAPPRGGQKKARRKAAPPPPPPKRKQAPRRNRDYKAEYARRIANAERKLGRALRPGEKGAARGHAAPIGMTEAQVKRLRRAEKLERFAYEQAAKFRGADPDEILEALQAMVREHGMSRLNELQRELGRMNREYMAQTARDRRGRRESLGYSLDEMSDRYGLPPETFGYH